MPHPNDTAGVRVLPPLVYLAGLAAGYLVWWFLPVPIVAGGGSPMRIAGIALILAGIALAAAALYQFRRAGTPPEPHKPTKALAFDGPYRFTRNPMYVGMALIQGGFALAGNALWPLLALVPVIWIVRTQVIAREEAYLEAKFGAPYRDFKARVRRWL
jgi:protein-S-isoprenylcysteine O-methyltransferase Ste14